MNAFLRGILLPATLACAMVWSSTSPAQTIQVGNSEVIVTNIQAVTDTNSIPDCGTFYLLQDCIDYGAGACPSPGDVCPECAAYSLGVDGLFLIDNTGNTNQTIQDLVTPLLIIPDPNAPLTNSIPWPVSLSDLTNVPPDQIPDFGNFYPLSDESTNASPTPVPDDPCDGCSVYSLGAIGFDGNYVFDDTGVVWPDPATNSVPGVNYPPAALRLYITGVSNSVMSLALTNTIGGVSYDILYKFTLADPAWGYAGTITGATNVNATPFTILTGNMSSLFFWAQVSVPESGLMLQIPPGGRTSGNLSVILWNTIPAQPYDVVTGTDLTLPISSWSIAQSVLGSSSNSTTVQLSVSGQGNFFVCARFAGSSSGGPIPDWWLLKYGLVGIDPYGQDSSGDGWTYLQDYINGYTPRHFVTPPPPQGFSVVYNSLSDQVTMSWQPSQGNVTGYTIKRFDPNLVTHQQFILSSNVFGVIDTSPITIFPPQYGEPTYSIQANYALGNSAIVRLSMFDPNTTATATLASGSQAETYLQVTSPIPQGTASFLLIHSYLDDILGTYIVSSLSLPLSSLINNVALVPNTFVNWPTESLDEEWYMQTAGGDGHVSRTEQVNYGSVPTPFFDGRQQMRQNADFQLRMANQNSALQYWVLLEGTWLYSVTYPSSYAYSGLYANDALDEFQPFEDNYFFYNFAYSPSNVDPNSGNLNTGVATVGGYVTVQNLSWQFASPTSYISIPPLLGTNTQWTAFIPQALSAIYPPYGLNYLGITGYYSLPAGTVNWFGLPYVADRFAFNHNGAFTTTDLYASNSIDGSAVGGCVYSDVAQPQSATVGYYFAQPGTAPLPGDSGFSLTNTTPPLLLAGYKNATSFAGYAKEMLLNGNANIASYIGQYFEYAYQVNSNGNVTTNSAGYVSPYGEFVGTVVGQVALVTMTNWGENVRGTSIVQVVRLQLDANHDGAMDFSFDGPDDTSPAHPYVHWVNNNYDRNTFDLDDETKYDDDVETNSPDAISQFTKTPTADFDYRDQSGNRIIPCARDLQDFARLWVCGMTSNVLAALPAGSTVTLSWGDVAYPNPHNPTIDLFGAIDPDGGIGYLTNSAIASEQVYNSGSVYLGRLGPGQSIRLNSAAFINQWAGNYFIWCGVTNGSGELCLTIADGSGNTLANTTAYIQIVDIKQLYERWTLGDDPSKSPYANAAAASEDLPPPGIAFQYTYNSTTDSNTSYILFVHGWNMQRWEKDRFAESAFKRLYWQGYHGRFGSFRWPTENGFQGISSLAINPNEKDNFDRSEYTAWRSGAALLNKLNDLNRQYPSHVYLLAHSMGNIVANEALRLSGSNHVVNTYVTSQAAVSAHTYDTNIANYSFSYPPWSSSAVTPNIYGNWFLGNNGGGARQVVNFYNTDDYALQRSVWQLNQLFKPDVLVLENETSWSYAYLGAPTDPPPWTSFMKAKSFGFTAVYFDIANVLTNRYEAMALAAQSYTTALGATPGVHNLADSIYLGRAAPTRIWPVDTTGNNYAAHFWHSAEFRGDYWQQQGYWSELLGADAFNLK